MSASARTITRKECPIHGPGKGSFVSDGVRYCTRCYPVYSAFVAVEYVPAEQLQVAVERLNRAAKLAAWIRRDRHESDKVLAYAQELVTLTTSPLGESQEEM